MPIQREKYPADWEAISRRIRDREGQRCGWCNAPNGVEVWRLPGGVYRVRGGDWKDRFGQPVPDDYYGDGVHDARLVRVVLTVAHLGSPYPDGRPGDKHDTMDVRDENLVALCQSCHLRFDHADHIRHAKETRRRKTALMQPALEI